MFSTLILAGIENLLNSHISAHPASLAPLQDLQGKVLRLTILKPRISEAPICLDMVFSERHLRFDPVSEPIFETNSDSPQPKADAEMIVENPKHLYSLITQPFCSNNINHAGDVQILANVHALFYGMNVDFGNLINKTLSALSPLANSVQNLTPGLMNNPSLKDNAKQFFSQFLNNTSDDMYKNDNQSKERHANGNFDQHLNQHLDEQIAQKQQILQELDALIHQKQQALNTLQNSPNNGHSSP